MEENYNKGKDKLMKRLVIIYAILLSIIGLIADVNLTVEMDKPQFKGNKFTKDLPLRQEAGAPLLPFYPVKILLPQGEDVESVQITLSESTILRNNIAIEETQQQQPISKQSFELTRRDEKIYSNDKAYPYEDYRFLGVQKLNGYSFAIINIYPYKYNPVTKNLNYFQTAEIALTTKASDAEQEVQILDFAKVEKKLRGKILNREASSTYREISSNSSRNIDLSSPKKLIIITNSNLVETMQYYADWKISQGVSTMIVETNEIYSNYNGVDNPAKIKTFITDAYNSWANTSSPLEYVILGGDDEIVPYRGVYGTVGSTIDYSMPSDLYYACLDGSWDDNGNGIYADQNEMIDLSPEISVGRMPAETATEFNHIFNKIISYESTNNYADNVAVMFGENLNNDPVTWGGDYKDEIKDRMPEDYLFKTRYQRDGNYSTPEVVEAINENATIMNHMGHANENTVCGLNSSTINNMLTNTQYGFLYTQGCYPAAFDNGTSGGTGGGNESVAEHLLIAEHGLHTFIGNTRYGWYYPGSTDGASQFFDRSFFDAMFIYDMRAIGESHNYSLLDNLNSALESTVMKWCYMEIVIFGDPSLSVKDFNPELAFIDINNVQYTDVIGDGDGNINPGETIEIEVELNNLAGWGTADSVLLELAISDDRFIILNSETSVGPLPTGSNLLVTTDAPSFTVPESISFSSFDYTIMVKGYNSNNELIFSKPFDFSFDITLMANNFPQEYSIGSKSAPLYLDYNNDNENELIYLDSYGNMKIIDLAGNIVLEQTSEIQENIYTSFAVTDHNGAPTMVYTSRTNNLVVQEIGGEVVFRYDSGSQFITSPMISDINGDGENEIIAINFGKELIAMNFEGDILPNFPVELDAFTVYEMATADLNGDNKADILVATNDNQLHAIDYQGQYLPNYPVTLPNTNITAPLITSDRIIVATINNLYSLDYAGNIIHQFEVSGNPVMPIANDFNNDGYVDYGFVTSTRKLYIVSETGDIFEGFPKLLTKNSQTPVLSTDVNEDEYPEIICFDSSNNIYIFDYQGNILPNFPFAANLATANPATLGDIHGDGELSFVLGYSQGIAMANLKLPVNEDVPAWLTYRNNYHRTGFMDTSFAVSNDNNNAEILTTTLAGNYPNPFNPETTIAFSLENASSVMLEIYNIKGQKVKTIANEYMDKGRHSIVWNGRDNAGRKVSSGVYLYRLRAGKEEFNSKMILMK